jgi:hypothetical protein
MTYTSTCCGTVGKSLDGTKWVIETSQKQLAVVFTFERDGTRHLRNHYDIVSTKSRR